MAQDLVDAPWIQSKTLPDAPFDTPDEDGEEFTKDILGKIYAGATLPIRGAAALGMGTGAGVVAVAHAAGSRLAGREPGDKNYGEMIQKAMSLPFEVAQTDASQKATENIGKWLYEVPVDISETVAAGELAYDPNAPVGSIRANPINEAKGRAQGNVLFNAAMFGSVLRAMQGKGKPQITPEQLKQAREDQSRTPPPPPDAPFTTQGELPLDGQARNPYIREPLVPDERGMPIARELTRDAAAEERQAGPQGQLFPEPTTPGMGVLGIDEARPLQRPTEVVEPQVRPTLELQPKDTIDLSKMREAATMDLETLKQEATAALKQGDLKWYTDTMLELSKRESKGVPDSIEFPLRQEELIKLRENYERWIKQAEEQGDTTLVAELKDQFASELPDYGVRTSREAVGLQPLYEQGVGTRLPIESSQRPLLGSPGTWGERTPYAPGGFEGGTPRVGGKWGKQGGFIDPRLLSKDAWKLPKTLGPRKFLDLFKGTYNAYEVSQLHLKDMILVSPEQFHSLAEARRPGFEDISSVLRNRIRQGLNTEAGLRDIPSLILNYDNKTSSFYISGHEGRHRMDVFKERGLENIPIKLHVDIPAKRAIEKQGWPDFVQQQAGDKLVPFPKPMSETIYSLGGPGKKQGGAIDFNFRKGEGKKIPLEERIRIAQLQYRDLLEAKNDAFDSMQRAQDDVGERRYMKEYEFLEKQFKAAQDHLTSLTDIVVRPKAEVAGTILGQTKFGESQRGGMKSDPEFKAFKNNLRDTLKPYAKELWKEINKTDKAVRPSVIEHQSEREAVAAIPGLKNALKYIEPVINKTTEEVLSIAKTSEPDINLSRLGRQMTSGAMLTGAWKESTLVHYVAQLSNRAKVVANQAKWNYLLRKDGGLKTLIDDLQGAKNVWKALMENEGIKDLTPEDFKKYNLTPDEIKVAEKFREVFNLIHDQLDATRKVLFGPNTATLHRRPGYIPGIFGGDFQGMIWRKHIGVDGKITLEPLSRFGANTRWGAEARKAYYTEHFKSLGDKLVIGEVEHRALKPLELRDSNIVFNEIAELLGKDDPLFQMVQELQERVIAGKAYDFAGVRKHFEPKKREGVLGAAGFELDLAPETNAQNGFQASLRYAEQAFDWMEMQKVGMEMKKILSDEEFKANRPNTHKYMDLYWKMESKQGTGLSKAVDMIAKSVAEFTGVGTSNVRDTLRAAKSALTIAALTTIKFGGVQVLQPVQMGFTMMAHLKGRGATGNPAYAFGMANADMTMLLTDKISGKSLASPVGREAMKWAEDKHILNSHILDDVRPETLQKILGGSREIAGLPLLKIEEYSRRFAYLEFNHFLHNSGMEVGPHMFETASNLTNMSMVDYRMHERPLFYQQLGVVGEAMSTLTPFKHNNYAQLFMAAKRGNRSHMLPTLLASSILFSGTIGLHFREDVDNLIHAINDWGPLERPLPTLAGLMVKNQPDGLTFGGVSAVSGGDLAASFGSARAAPQGGFDAIFPWTSDIWEKGKTAYTAIRNPSEDTALAAAHRWAPNQAKFLSEEAAASGKMSVNPETHEGIIERDETDLNWRRLGGRSLKESKELIKNRDATMYSRSIKAKQSSLVEKAAQSPDASQIDKWKEEYVKLDNNPATAASRFIAAIKKYEFNKNTSQRTRIIMKGGPAAARRLEYDK
ncbi:MAG: hypothetical protein NUV80_07475 [Candidatus Berkelbacteria bacterium]|nr:hypothetical protein [Candidatus Berkelbacteria bacterium]